MQELTVTARGDVAGAERPQGGQAHDEGIEDSPRAWYVPADTTREAYEFQNEAYRRMGGAGRTQVMFRLTEMARHNALAGIRERHPAYDQAQLTRAWFRLVHGDELAREVWPELALVDP